MRREYLRGVLARKTAPKCTLRYAVGEVLAAPGRVGDGKDEILAELVGVEGGNGRTWRLGAAQAPKATESRLPLVLLAQVAADREQTMDVQTWRRPDPAAARYLSFLASTGYQLSEIEQQVVSEGMADHEADAEGLSGDDEQDARSGDLEPEDDVA